MKRVESPIPPAQQNIEEDYSDSFEDIQGEGAVAERDSLEDQKEQENFREDIEDRDDIEQFLRTATENDIAELKNSLSNFGFGGFKQGGAAAIKAQKREDEDYIEEEFEENHDSDNESGSDSSNKARDLEQQRKKGQQQPVMISKNIATTARNARNRPISATFNLEATKVNKQQNTQINMNLNPYESSGASYQQFNNFAQSQLTNQLQPSYSQASILMKDYGKSKYSGAISSQVMETPKQPNDFMKKPINTNPFRRPFSQNIPMRKDIQKPPPSKDIITAQSIKEDEEERKTSPKQPPPKQLQKSESQPIPINAILQKIEKLEDWQKEKLLEILDHFDIGALASNLPSAKKQSEATQPLNLNFLSPVTQPEKPVAASHGGKGYMAPRTIGYGIPEEGKYELIIRVLKTYGNPHICGLTEIELFNAQSQKISLAPASISVRNLGQGPKNSLTKLLDGHKLTNEERHMWIGYLPMQPKNLDIVILLQKDVEVGGLKIWNYNKSAIDCTKGIKEVQILTAQYNPISKIDEQTSRWQGIIERGKGQINADYSTIIKLRDDVVIQKELKQAKPDNSQPRKSQIVPPPPLDQELDKEDETTRVVTTTKVSHQSSQNSSQQPPIKDQPSEPIWLAGDKQKLQNNVASQINKDLDLAAAQKEAKTTRRVPGGQIADTKTTELLGKNYTQPFATPKEITSPSVNSGGLPQAFKNRASNKSVISGAGGPVKKATQEALGGVLPNSSSRLQEANDAIKQAVNKVNDIIHGGASGQQSVPPFRGGQLVQDTLKEQNQLNVEDSLDNLDLFKATNLGRLLQNSNINEADKIKESAMKSIEKRGTQSRAQWGMSPNQRNLESSSKHKGGAHVLVKNPFPEQLMSSKGSSMSISKKQMSLLENTNNDLDILDQFLNPVGQTKKNAQEEFSAKIDPSLQKDIPHQEFGKRLLPQKFDIKPNTSKSFLTYQEKLAQFGTDFNIPKTPIGSTLEFNILTTWGDLNYVGLTGIEIFDSNGMPVKIDDTKITACPPDINILPGYGGDPRTIDKLVDGHYFTNDDLHVWLTPFTAGDDHIITIDLGRETQIAMIRVWNYNKSRIHSYRGARLVTCELDGRTIFRGEILKAPGNLNDPEGCCEIIVFTDNDQILEKIDANDWINEKIVQRDMEDTQRIMQDVLLDERPLTATKKFNTAEIEDIQKHLRQQKPNSLFDERPQTSAIITGDHFSGDSQWDIPKNVPLPLQDKSQNEHSDMVRKAAKETGLRGRVIEIHITETWGDLFYVGLTGIEVYDNQGKLIPVNVSQVTANPRDMNQLGGSGTDYRTLDKLFDGTNNTADDHHMWLIPFNEGELHEIVIDLGKPYNIGSIRFFNYNKSEEDTLRGAKQVLMWLDKKYITPRKGLTVRKATGFVHPLLNMGHDIKLPVSNGWTTEQIIPMQKPQAPLSLLQEYELSHLPMGFVLKLNLFSTYGDFYYIGLNGLEVFDQRGMIVMPSQVIAEPQGVHTLTGMSGDVRVAANLINGKNQTYDEQNMWLAPFKNTRSYSAVSKAQDSSGKTDTPQQGEHRIPNFVCLIFDEPVVVAGVRLWNYAKTPSRGVNEFEILIDDTQLYRGFAKPAPEKAEFDCLTNKDFSTVVLFTSDEKFASKFQANVNYDPSKNQSVALINEKKILPSPYEQQRGKRRPNEEFQGVYNELERPSTIAHRKFY